MQEKASGNRTSTFAPLRHGTYRAIWTANLFANMGSQVQTVGAAWLMTSIAASDDMVALVQASTTLPVMLFSLLSGAIADNFSRRKVMIIAQGFMLAVSAALAAAAYFGAMTPWFLLCFTFLIGCGTALNQPAWQAAVGDMVPRRDLAEAVTLNSMGFNLTRSVGPAIGGLIVGLAGAAAAFAVNALSYLPPIWVLARWKSESTQQNALPREFLGSAMQAGLRYIALSPNIGKVILRAFVFGFTAIVVLALLPLVVRNQMGAGPFTFGVMLGCFGFGAIGGALLNTRVRSLLPAEWIVRCSFLGFALCATVTALSSSPFVTGPAILIGGACWVLGLSLFNVTVQLSTPRWVVARALAIYQTASFGGMAAGSWIWGLVADAHDTRTALISAAIVMLAGALLGRLIPIPSDTSLNLAPANRFREPRLALDLKPRSGPILITVEYVIKEADVEEFLKVMTERRRIRHRDGARQWTLTRDLENPAIWNESYHFPTWIDYLRHHQRITQEDLLVIDRVRHLHSGTEPPKVRRMIERPTNWYEMIAHRDTIDMP